MTIPHSPAALAALCRRYGIARLVVFGSVARGTPRPDSDIDLVAEFAAGSPPELPAGLEGELGRIFGRRAEVLLPERLTPASRERVAREGRRLHPPEEGGRAASGGVGAAPPRPA